MEHRTLGTQGLRVSALGLGTMGMTGFAGMPELYGAPDEAEGIATIHRALELGIDFFDTAEVYGPWSNERLLGRALAGRRDRAIIATKFGFAIAADGRMTGVDGRPENVRRALDGCLQRLGTDHIDLWYQHRRDRDVPIEETVGAMAEQVRAGKVRFLGLSEMSATTIRRAHAVHPISAVQSEYSLWERNIEEPAADGGPGVLATCRELGIGTVPYSPLGRGFLTGALPSPAELPETDYRRSYDPRFAAGNYERNLARLAIVRAVAARRGASVAQVALAWLLQRGPDVVPIPGTKRVRWVEDNAASTRLALTAQDLAELDAISNADGARYAERGMAAIER
jgi:aryl-alcohol dehydrogenase-like predicted oxidoreductase